jgi:hypothetical protein
MLWTEAERQTVTSRFRSAHLGVADSADFAQLIDREGNWPCALRQATTATRPIELSATIRLGLSQPEYR